MINAYNLAAKNNVKKLLLLSGLMLITSASANALTFDADVYIKIRTERVDCQPIADSIVDLTRKYIDANDESHKAHYAKKAKKKKKKLKKCEKRCDEDDYKNLVAYLDGMQFGFTHSF